jgi:hypothetical protein
MRRRSVRSAPPRLPRQAAAPLELRPNVLGGLAFQIPVGRLSDRFDRRIVPAVLSTGLAGAPVALVRLPHSALLITSLEKVKPLPTRDIHRLASEAN